jgi:hypothetical protein
MQRAFPNPNIHHHMTKMKQLAVFLFCFLVYTGVLKAIVKYQEGALLINGIQLLQDRENAKDYYYLPQYPRLAQKEDGSFEIVCIKYVGTGGPETNGGLFHALVEFTLPQDVVDAVQAKLQALVPGGRVVGPVPMQENIKDGESGMASFEVVSSILSSKTGDKPLTQSFITNGHAPLLPGSRAAIAAKLSQEGATLLWASFQGATSDVSIAINGYYEAAVKGYNAVIEAEASTIYTHFSQIMNEQEGFTRNQMRDITDKLIQNKTLKVDVFDRSNGLGIKTDDMQAIVDLVTNKLIELMFDAKTGWAVAPTTEVAVEQNQLPGRQERGFFSKLFSGAHEEPYVTDHQFVLKRRKDVRINKFYLNLSKSTTIKLPFFTTGNIRGFYSNHQKNDQYFRVVNLDDPDFKKREILFQVDGEFAQSFSEILNFVSVSFKKSYGNGQPDVTKEIVIKGKDLEKGTDLQGVVYPALGLSGNDLIDYNYRISWSFKGNSTTVLIPPNQDQWLKAKEAAVSLKPPFEKKLIEIDADRATFKDAGYKSATVRVFAVLNGKPQVQKTLVLRAEDVLNTSKVAVYHDSNQPVAYQVTWYPLKNGKPIEGPVQELTDTYLYLIPQ